MPPPCRPSCATTCQTRTIFFHDSKCVRVKNWQISGLHGPGRQSPLFLLETWLTITMGWGIKRTFRHFQKYPPIFIVRVHKYCISLFHCSHYWRFPNCIVVFHSTLCLKTTFSLNSDFRLSLLEKEENSSVGEAEQVQDKIRPSKMEIYHS